MRNEGRRGGGAHFSLSAPPMLTYQVQTPGSCKRKCTHPFCVTPKFLFCSRVYKTLPASNSEISLDCRLPSDDWGFQGVTEPHSGPITITVLRRRARGGREDWGLPFNSSISTEALLFSCPVVALLVTWGFPWPVLISPRLSQG